MSAAAFADKTISASVAVSVIRASQSAVAHGAQAPMQKRRHESSMPRVLAPDDWLGRHPVICIALVAVLLLLSASF